MSKYDGNFEFELNGRPLTICYDWAALAALSEFPESVKEIAKPINEVNPERVAEVMACGLMRHHPEMTKDVLLEMSPPLYRCIRVIDTALTYAYFGADEKPDDKKKLTKKKKPTLWRMLFR